MNRLQNLDALRFFLSAIVVLYHLPRLSRNQGLPFYDALPIFHKGIEAVYMFFVLSGFLIIRLIYRAKKRDTFSIKNFYVRRILRIFPLYYLIIVLGFLIYNVFLPALNITFDIKYNITEGILLTVFFMPNIFAVKFEPGGILEILWSIGIEEQFYLLIAPLLYFTNKHKILILLATLTSVYFVIFHLKYFEFLKHFEFVYFLLFFGGITSILEEKKLLNMLKKNIFFPALIFLITVLYFFTNWFEFESVWVSNAFTMVLFGLFIHTISCNHNGFTIKNKWINYFGKISYGIYMYHVLALNLIVFLFLKIKKIEIFNESITIVLLNILTFALTIFVSHFSYKYFEKYFLRLKNKFR